MLSIDMIIISHHFSSEMWQLAGIFFHPLLVQLVSSHLLFIPWKIISTEQRNVHSDECLIFSIQISLLKDFFFVL